MGFLLQFATLVLVTYIVQYFYKNRRYFTLALKLPCSQPLLLHCAKTIYYALYLRLDFIGMGRKLLAKEDDDGIKALWLKGLFVAVTNAKYAQQLLTNRKFIDKAQLYDAIVRVIGPTGLASAKGEEFRNSKRVFSRAFNLSSMVFRVDNFKKGCDEMVDEIKKNLTSDWMQLTPYIRHATGVNIFRTTFGLELRDHEDTFEVADTMREWLIESSFEQYLGPIAMPFVKNLNKTRKNMENINNDIFIKTIQQLMDIATKKGDIPNIFSFNVFRERPNITPQELGADVNTIITAALDTSTSAASLALQLLGMHPEIQQTVFREDQEVQKMIGDRKTTANDLNHYHYLDRVIKETLRLYPPIPLYARNTAEETPLGEYTIPKGAAVGIFLPRLHRDPESYPNPTKFDPDRFLPENVEKRHKFSYLPFSYGPRSCSGMRYGTQSVMFIVSTIIRHFKVTSYYKSVEELDENVRSFTIISDNRNCPCLLQKRS